MASRPLPPGRHARGGRAAAPPTHLRDVKLRSIDGDGARPVVATETAPTTSASVGWSAPRWDTVEPESEGSVGWGARGWPASTASTAAASPSKAPPPPAAMIPPVEAASRSTPVSTPMGTPMTREKSVLARWPPAADVDGPTSTDAATTTPKPVAGGVPPPVVSPAQSTTSSAPASHSRWKKPGPVSATTPAVDASNSVSAPVVSRWKKPEPAVATTSAVAAPAPVSAPVLSRWKKPESAATTTPSVVAQTPVPASVHSRWKKPEPIPATPSSPVAQTSVSTSAHSRWKKPEPAPATPSSPVAQTPVSAPVHSRWKKPEAAPSTTSSAVTQQTPVPVPVVSRWKKPDPAPTTTPAAEEPTSMSAPVLSRWNKHEPAPATTSSDTARALVSPPVHSRWKKSEVTAAPTPSEEASTPVSAPVLSRWKKPEPDEKTTPLAAPVHSRWARPEAVPAMTQPVEKPTPVPAPVHSRWAKPESAPDTTLPVDKPTPVSAPVHSRWARLEAISATAHSEKKPTPVPAPVHSRWKKPESVVDLTVSVAAPSTVPDPAISPQHVPEHEADHHSINVPAPIDTGVSPSSSVATSPAASASASVLKDCEFHPFAMLLPVYSVPTVPESVTCVFDTAAAEMQKSIIKAVKRVLGKDRLRVEDFKINSRLLGNNFMDPYEFVEYAAKEFGGNRALQLIPCMMSLQEDEMKRHNVLLAARSYRMRHLATLEAQCDPLEKPTSNEDAPALVTPAPSPAPHSSLSSSLPLSQSVISPIPVEPVKESMPAPVAIAAPKFASVHAHHTATSLQPEAKLVEEATVAQPVKHSVNSAWEPPMATATATVARTQSMREFSASSDFVVQVVSTPELEIPVVSKSEMVATSTSQMLVPEPPVAVLKVAESGEGIKNATLVPSAHDVHEALSKKTEVTNGSISDVQPAVPHESANAQEEVFDEKPDVAPEKEPLGKKRRSLSLFGDDIGPESGDEDTSVEEKKDPDHGSLNESGASVPSDSVASTVPTVSSSTSSTAFSVYEAESLFGEVPRAPVEPASSSSSSSAAPALTPVLKSSPTAAPPLPKPTHSGLLFGLATAGASSDSDSDESDFSD